MQAPAAGFVEAAVDKLKEEKSLPNWLRLAQQKELYSATGESSEEFGKGYELGLQVARLMLAASPLILMKGIDPKDLL